MVRTEIRAVSGIYEWLKKYTSGSRNIRAVRDTIRALFGLYEWFGSRYERFAHFGWTREVTYHRLHQVALNAFDQSRN
ncbi:hypothetical protein [Sporosarcina cyprini]|uniref:hypothetical protein n=1 Tax=Sporosarcina cyprini TaxID=2910523 RepID=UPI001EE0D699|nr:hypothetical protein [Sporosarcina cyprini]MCG3087040.1 hypothetical protein [Sporosarcina cyprini]